MKGSIRLETTHSPFANSSSRRRGCPPAGEPRRLTRAAPGPTRERMRIATWNINGVKARLEGAVTWLKETSPDVACFQEIKSVTEAFPSQAFEDLGYNV